VIEGEHQGIVRGFHAAFGARDLDTCAALLAPDVDWHAPTGFPFGGHHSGVDAVRGYLTDLWGFFDDVDLGTPELHVAGASVMAVGVETVVTLSGERHELEYSQLFAIEDGLIATYRERGDAGRVVKAVSAEMAFGGDAGR
jgi:ketosteroid isomerase-like protein